MPVVMTTLVGFDYLLLYGLIVIELVEEVSHQTVEDCQRPATDTSKSGRLRRVEARKHCGDAGAS
jgi:hypothetical protein